MTTFTDMLLASGPVKYLTQDEEYELFRRWREEEDRAAYDQLFRSQVFYALKLVGKHKRKRSNIDNEERQSVACEALLNAIEKFEPERGFRLSTLVKVCVPQALRRYESDHGSIIRVPEAAVYKEHAEKAQSIASIDYDRNYECTTASIIADGGPTPYEQAAEQEWAQATRDDIRRALKLLHPKYRYVLEQRFFENRTCEDIGNELGLTRSRVQQIDHKARWQLKSHLGSLASEIPHGRSRPSQSSLDKFVEVCKKSEPVPTNSQPAVKTLKSTRQEYMKAWMEKCRHASVRRRSAVAAIATDGNVASVCNAGVRGLLTRRAIAMAKAESEKTVRE